MSFRKVPNFLGNLFVMETPADSNRYFRFREFLLDTVERELSRNGEELPLTPKAFDTLEFLVRNAGRLITKDALMEAIWPNSFVDEGNLPRTIHTLRKALGEDENGNKFIKTVPTKGYRFVADVEPLDHNGHVEPTVDSSTLSGEEEINVALRMSQNTRRRAFFCWERLR